MSNDNAPRIPQSPASDPWHLQHRAINALLDDLVDPAKGFPRLDALRKECGK